MGQSPSRGLSAIWSMPLVLEHVNFLSTYLILHYESSSDSKFNSPGVDHASIPLNIKIMYSGFTTSSNRSSKRALKITPIHNLHTVHFPETVTIDVAGRKLSAAAGFLSQQHGNIMSLVAGKQVLHDKEWAINHACKGLVIVKYLTATMEFL